jgi:hypothetical protein
MDVIQTEPIYRKDSVHAASIYAHFTFAPLTDHDWRGWWVMTLPDFLDTDGRDIVIKL